MTEQLEAEADKPGIHECGSPICPLEGMTTKQAYLTAAEQIDLWRSLGTITEAEATRILEQLADECSETELLELAEIAAERMQKAE